MSYQGRQDATHDRVRQYLAENYTEKDGTSLSQARLTELLTDHVRVLEQGIANLSYANYVGDQIADEDGLVRAGEASDR